MVKNSSSQSLVVGPKVDCDTHVKNTHLEVAEEQRESMQKIRK
jgi:hypothetical protein